ncbi:MAG: MFS transporter [Flavobacteriaceae bacterium CG_4_8_14_3_um_filter_34_10]|nr:MAG: MFS transporter [Flavobacteriaceae bacterium CG18_big_fil_WC_8_21_14_2_50_34_36]PIX10668.1 MAG: MFS transporter [Flavobacteriaceae bacterium CG_4_8_14_3_um_filter_34_10]PIZ07452.1 MAG: MFS transporter [Flavobacteriaceae bacterium CG_4_10_14_0_8_um_filter_34_31]PJC07263.1 MAG: MFS transporter [Flavobacteriaceae bacterium CG_4_9_14_0_8_um_filter_34_30]
MATTNSSSENFFATNVLGHPAGLFVLFFTEMWERFSYYGMRAILVLFLVSAFGLGGWDWPREHALALYGTYTALVYLTPILGGYIADKYIGFRKAVVIGALLMTLGHASMAMEFEPIFLYIGIGLLIAGNGFFKPNITSIISQLYKDFPEKKDGAYTIFYMGVNAGAFLGILLCGYLGEKIGWSYGFGLAGVFMLLGMLQFYFAQKIFGEVGKKPLMETEESKAAALDFEGDRLNPFTLFDKVIIVLVTIIGLVWIINDPASKIGGSTLLELGGVDYSNQTILVGLVLFLVLLISRILRYPAIIRDRMIAIVFFAIFTVCFWASFEQAGGSMTIFAKDYTNRIMSGNYATLFLISNILITVVPIAIITWVLYLLFKQTYKKYLLSNVILGFSFLLIWALVAWMINRDMNSNAFVIDYLAIEKPILDNQGLPVLDKATKEPMFTYEVITESTQIQQSDKVVNQQVTIIEPIEMNVGEEVSIVDVDKRGNFIFLNKEKAAILRNSFKSNEKSTIVKATVNKIKENEIEIPATWFLILNSLFIIIFAPLFSKWWESKYNPSGATKYGLGLVLLGIGFSALAFGSMGIDQGAKVASVSIIWLVLAYLFHTLGELCLSPVALSYISKLVPGRMIAMMFGIWYIAIAIGNKIAGSMGGKIDAITEQYDMTTFFLIFTFVPVGLGLVSILLNPLLKKLMHGVR